MSNPSQPHGGVYIPPHRSRHVQPLQTSVLSSTPSTGHSPSPLTNSPGVFSGSQTPYYPNSPPNGSYGYQNFSPASSQQTVQQPAPYFASSFTSSPQSTSPPTFYRPSPYPQSSYPPSNYPQGSNPQSSYPPGMGSQYGGQAVQPQQYQHQQTQPSNPNAQYSNSGTFSTGISSANSRTYGGSGDIESQYPGDPEKHATQTSVVSYAEHNVNSSGHTPTFRRNRVFAPSLYWLDFFESDVIYRWRKAPRLVKPGVSYGSSKVYRLKDYMGRVIYRAEDDRYLSAFDGRAKQLIVQSCDDLFYRPNSDTWMRTRVTDRTPWHLRIAAWCMENNDGDTAKLVGKYIVAVILMAMPVVPKSPEGATVNNGCFEKFPYMLRGYPEVSRNPNEDPYRWQPAIIESEKPGMLKRRQTNPLDRVEERVLGPSKLCTVDGDEFLINVHNWDAAKEGRPFPEYVFVAYTSEQFPTQEHWDVLNEIGKRAAREAKVGYYWVGCSCMSDVDRDLYRISDIVRAAKKVVVAIYPSNQAHTPMAMLKQFGERVWTFPEILLAPKDQNGILVYGHGVDAWRITFNQFARDVWADSLESRQLVDHFQGTLQMSHLELAIAGLKCFYGRELGIQYPGDKAYALMGLLRLRPPVNPGETAFQAFARMSLLNHADSLLERLICVQPVKSNQPWYDVSDAYNAKLWDIYPTCQISGIGHADSNMDEDQKRQVNDTVIVDGMRAAKVRWKSFAPVKKAHVFSWTRAGMSKLLQWSSVSFFVGVILVAIGMASVGAFFLVVGLIGICAGPKLLVVIYGGKYWNVQPWLFGVEGYIPVHVLEAYVFGLNQGFLKWSAFGSPLSRHHKDEFGEFVGDDPMTYPDVRERVENAMNGRDPDRKRIFTLIDTHSMTATLFEAERPPIAFLLAGAEGGYQRAIGVSCDWKTNTLYRETVLRMETTALDYMSRVGRVRLGLQRPGSRNRKTVARS